MKNICQEYMPSFYRSFGELALEKAKKSLDDIILSDEFSGVYLIGLWEDGGYDNGFDVAKYSVNHRFGTDSQLDYFIDKAHRSGLEVGVDVVPNHVSDKHFLAQNCLNGVSGYEDCLYVVSEAEAKRLTEAGVVNVNGKLAYSDFGDKYVRTTFCDHHQLNLNWNSQRVQEYFVGIFDKLTKMGVDFVRVDCGQLLLEDVSRARKDDFLACFNPRASVEAVRKVAGGMKLFFEWLDLASAIMFDDMSGCYALDCSYVITGKLNMRNWSYAKNLIPEVGGHDQETLRDRGMSYKEALKYAEKKEYFFSDMQTILGWETDPNVLPGDEDYDADAKHPSLFSNRRYRARRPIEPVLAAFHKKVWEELKSR